MPRQRPEARLALLHQPLPAQVRVSPDGRRLLVVVRWCDLEGDRNRDALVWIDAGTGRRRLLTPAAHDDTQPSWMPDGRAAVFVSTTSGSRDLWLQHLPDGGRERLTQLGARVDEPQTSPGGRRVAFLYGAPGGGAARLHVWTRRDAASAAHAARGFGWIQLWMLDLRTRRCRRLVRARGDVTAFAWSPDDRRLAYIVQPEPFAPESAELWIATLGAGGAARRRRLTRQRGPKLAVSWSPDGAALAYVGHQGAPGEVEPLGLWRLPARGGKPVDLLHGKDLHCAAAGFDGDAVCTPPVWSADGKRLFFLASRAGSVQIFAVSAAGGRPVPQTRGAHRLTSLVAGARGGTWALLREDDTHPAAVYVAAAPAARRGVALRRLAHQRPAPAGAIRQQQFELPAPQGRRIHTFVLRAARRRGPALFVLHGGTGAMAGFAFEPELQILAAAGYHVVCANIRGSAGYGRDTLRGLVGRWGVDDLADVHAVADWIESRSFVDPRRIALMGGGDGGSLALWALGHTARFRCAVTTGGASDLVALHGTSPAAARLRAEFGVPPWEAHERYWRTSPLAFVERVRTPLLIVQAEHDRRCPPSQAQELYTALAHLGRDVEMLLFHGEGHDFPRRGRPSNRRERLRRVLDWLARTL